MDGLKRVNLFVGENGAGKTSLVEALMFLQVGGHHNLLVDVSTRRGELAPARAQGDSNQVWLPNVERWFDWAATSESRSPLLVEGIGGPTKSAELQIVHSNAPISVSAANLANIGFDVDPMRYCLVKFTDRADAELKVRFPLSRSRALLPYPEILDESPGEVSDHLTEKRNSLLLSGVGGVAQVFVKGLWAHARARNERRKRVVESLGLLRTDIQGIELDPTDAPPSSMFGIQDFSVQLTGVETPVKLGSLGGGAAHCLLVALGLAYCEGGSLGVDEIDTGLHYSMMADFWSYLIATARKLNVQVFATTHSWDCIEGLAEACRRDESFLPEVAVHSIHRHLPESLPHDGKSILDMTRYDLDPR